MHVKYYVQHTYSNLNKKAPSQNKTFKTHSKDPIRQMNRQSEQQFAACPPLNTEAPPQEHSAQL